MSAGSTSDGGFSAGYFFIGDNDGPQLGSIYRFPYQSRRPYTQLLWHPDGPHEFVGKHSFNSWPSFRWLAGHR